MPSPGRAFARFFRSWYTPPCRMDLEISTREEKGEFVGAKFLKFPVLASGEDLKELFQELPGVELFPLRGVSSGVAIDRELFLAQYRDWIADIQEGKEVGEKEVSHLSATAWTDDPKALWLQAVSGGFLVRIARPVWLVQPHFFTYSEVDGEFRSMSMGPKRIFWGLLFSYPQVGQCQKTGEIEQVEKGELFRVVQMWVRRKSRATSFLVRGERKISSIRRSHSFSPFPYPALQKLGIEVE